MRVAKEKIDMKKKEVHKQMIRTLVALLVVHAKCTTIWLDASPEPDASPLPDAETWDDFSIARHELRKSKREFSHWFQSFVDIGVVT